MTYFLNPTPANPTKPADISALLSQMYAEYLNFEQQLSSPAYNVGGADYWAMQATGSVYPLTAKNAARVGFILNVIAQMNDWRQRLAVIQASLVVSPSLNAGEGAASRALVEKAKADLDSAIAIWSDGLKACQAVLNSTQATAASIATDLIGSIGSSTKKMIAAGSSVSMTNFFTGG
jgi:hypothetical protein